MTFCDSCQPWARLKTSGHPSGLSPPSPAGTQTGRLDGHELCAWDQEVSGRGSARSAEAPVQRKLDDAALCFPLGLNKIRKSGLDSVLSLLSSGSTCFLTLAPFFLSRGSHLHMGLADNDILFISMFWTYHSVSSGCPGPLQNNSLHIQPSPGHNITWPHCHLTTPSPNHITKLGFF